MYKNFEKLIATGGSGMTLADEVEEQKELEKSDLN